MSVYRLRTTATSSSIGGRQERHRHRQRHTRQLEVGKGASRTADISFISPSANENKS
jgi:hypothetical protein